jgi:hypothetical protein
MTRKYPNEQPRSIAEWCEAVGEIKKDDNATLPRLVKEADTKTLMGVLESHDGMLEDHRKFPDVAFWSAWDEKVMHSVREELRQRGLKPLQGALAEGELGKMMRQSLNDTKGKTKQ